MQTIYGIYWDNNESWDDHRQGVNKEFYTTKEAAQTACDKLNNDQLFKPLTQEEFDALPENERYSNSLEDHNETVESLMIYSSNMSYTVGSFILY